MAANLPKIVVKTDITDLDTPHMISEAKGIKFTGDADATAPDYDDTALHGAADDLQDVHSERQTDPPTASSDDENTERRKVARMYELDALYVQKIANNVAIAAGDVEAGEAVVHRIGFKLKKSASAHARGFEVYDSGVQWAKVRTKAVAATAAYAWRYGMTAAKGTPPEIDGTRVVVNLEASLEITNLESGKIYGIQYETVRRKERKTYVNGEEALIYSDWIYFVVE
jgi:hypothetical protein